MDCLQTERETKEILGAGVLSMKRAGVFPLAIGVACLAFVGPSFAQSQYGASTPANSASADSNHSASANSNSTAGQQEATTMVPAEANLARSLDAKKMQPGKQFTAKLTQTVHLMNGPELRRGTILVGTVSTDDMQLSGNSKLALRITEARLSDGKTIPIKATIVGILPSGTPVYSDSNPWTRDTLQVDQIGVLSGVDLHSRVAGQNSGVFVSTKKDDVKLQAGSEMMLAIAPQQNVASGGE
jgi:hypothetical protein